jgi:hypothetical protein
MAICEVEAHLKFLAQEADNLVSFYHKNVLNHYDNLTDIAVLAGNKIMEV